jgi:hypothetical protein
MMSGADPGMKGRSGPDFGWEVRACSGVWAADCETMRNRVMMLATNESTAGVSERREEREEHP